MCVKVYMCGYIPHMFILFHSIVACNLFKFLRCADLWSSFQYERETLVDQMNDAESKMAMFTTAKATSIQQAEDKCQRYKVGHCLTLHS